MEEKYQNFLKFNWTDSKEWHSYLENDLYPRPPLNKIDFFKKKFYRAKIDPDFDINYTPQNTQSNNNQNSSNASYRQQNPYMNPPPGLSQNLSKILQNFEIFFWLLFLGLTLIGSFSLKVSALALALRTFRRVGIPKFNIEFAQHLFLDEHFQIFLYNLLFMVDRLNFFTLIPLFMTMSMHFAEYLKFNEVNFLKSYYEKFYNKRVEIASLRSNIELAIGFLLFIGIILGLNNFLTPIFYWQFLRFKYIVNQDTKNSFALMNFYINRFKISGKCPAILRIVIGKIQEFAEYMGRTEATENQRAGGANCVIF